MIKISVMVVQPVLSGCAQRVGVRLTLNKSVRGMRSDNFLLSFKLPPEKTNYELSIPTALSWAKDITRTMSGDKQHIFLTLPVILFKRTTEERIKNIISTHLDEAMKRFIMDMAIKG